MPPSPSGGPLNPDKGPLQMYDLGETIKITGALPTDEARTTLQSRWTAMVGDRSVRLDVTILNEDLCAIRKVLPATRIGQSDDLAWRWGDR